MEVQTNRYDLLGLGVVVLARVVLIMTGVHARYTRPRPAMFKDESRTLRQARSKDEDFIIQAK